MDKKRPGGELPPAMRRRLADLHDGLLNLHKILLDEERSIYEKTHGRTPPAQILQLVIGDPQFAWLRRISELIVQIDELLESEGDKSSAISELIDQTRSLLAPGDAGDEFSRKYQEALQRQPDAVMAHGKIAAVLSRD